MASIYGELIRAQLHLSASDLTPVASGLIYLNTTSHQVKWYANAAWKTAVDLDTAQTLTNKTLVSAVIDAYVDINEETTPATPSAGAVRLYAKSDQKLYTKDSNGVENEVGSGSGGSGEKNYVTNPSADSAITGWVSSAGGLTVTRTTTASELPREYTTGTGIKIVAPVGDPTNVYVYYDFTLDDIDLNKKLKIQWSQKQFGTYAASDFEVYIAAQSARGTILHTPDVTLVPAYDGVFTASFDTASTATLSLVIRARVNMATDAGLVISDVIVGPGTITAAAPIGTPTSYTPTGLWTTNTTYTGSYTRVGSWMKLSGTVSLAGAPNATVLTVNLPSGFTIDTSVPGFGADSTAPIGFAKVRDVAPGNTITVTPYINNTTSITFGNQDDTGSGGGVLISAQVQETIPITWASGDYLRFEVELPIAEWAGAPNYAGSNDVEYASNDSTTDADNTTTFVYGPVGSLIPTIASTVTGTARLKRVRFQTPIQVTDDIQIELQLGGIGNWIPIQTQRIYATNLQQSGTRYGIGWTNVSGSSTDIDVAFQRGGANASNATYAGAGTSMPDTAGDRYRIKKARAGAAVGFGIAGDDTRNGLTTKNITGTTQVTSLQTMALGASAAKVTLGGTDIAVTLPTAGTYLVMGIVHVDPTSASGEIIAKLYNSTDAADVSGSNRIFYLTSAETSVPIDLSSVVTVASSKTIQFFAWRDSGLTAANAFSGSSASAKLTYIRLY